MPACTHPDDDRGGYAYSPCHKIEICFLCGEKWRVRNYSWEAAA